MNPNYLVPKIGASQAKTKFNANNWFLFARRCQRNPFMREMIMQRDLQKPCEWCQRPILMTQSWCIHHIDYEHECTYGVTVIEQTTSRYGNARNYNGPDCRACSFMHPEKFSACFARLKLVHFRCNQQIELKRLNKK